MFDQSKTYYFVTPVLPYTPDGTIDERQYRSLLRTFLQDIYIDVGMALIANPEAGEVFYLDRAEKRRVVEIAVEEAAGRVPVFAGVIDTTTAGTVAVAQDAAAAGADGLFVMPPIGALDVSSSWNADAYPEVFTDMLHAITASVDLPVIVHPTSSPTPGYGIGIPARATRTITEAVPQIVGWKMTYNYDGYRTLTRTLRGLDRPVKILGAAAVYFHENLATGAFDGTATGSWNYAREAMFEHIQAWNRGDLDAAQKIWNGGLAQLQEYVYADYSRLHIRYKIACWLRGLISSPDMRAPLPRPKQDEVHTLARLLTDTGLSVIDDDAVSSYLHARTAA
ncbi:dihydrodipicolinate synthase family protein [Streptomyces sp. NPDC055134]